MHTQGLDLFLTLAGLVAILATMILVAAYFRRGRLNHRALWLAPALWLLNSSALFAGAALQKQYLPQAGLSWNWIGKILAVASTLLCIRLLRGLDLKQAGITLRQRPGSFWPTLAVIVVVCAIGAIVQQATESPQVTRPETWLYQLLMPSIDEELFNRGLLLFYLAHGLDDQLDPRSWKIDLSVWIVTLQFTFAHAFSFAHGRPMFDIETFVAVFYYSYLLGWARQRTGSVALPMLAHTLANTLYRLI